MRRDADHWLATRRSLLARLKDSENQSGWQEFFDSYGKLIYGVALKSGLMEGEAEDAVQETAIAVARHIAEFKYDPVRCSFKTWLMLLTRQRIVHQFRKRQKPARAVNRAGHGASDDSSEVAPGSDGYTGMTDARRRPAMDQVADPASSQLEMIWEEEWQKYVMAAALEEVKRQVSDRQFQMFDLYMRQGWSVADVAKTLHVNAAQIYLAKHRVGRLLRQAVAKAEREELRIQLDV